MKYNEVTIRSKALGGSELLGILNKAPNPRGAVLLSHNSHGTMDEPVLMAIESYIFRLGYTTLRYNFHYVGRMPVESAKFEDLMRDIDAAYATVLEKALARNMFLVGKSIGGVASLKYLSDNNLRCPLLILGFFEPGVLAYVPDSVLKFVQAPVTVLQGEKDQYTQSENVRVLLGRNRVNYQLFEIKNALHGLTSNDESARSSSDILRELELKTAEFLSKPNL